jgi:hypothetical protein
MKIIIYTLVVFSLLIGLGGCGKPQPEVQVPCSPSETQIIPDSKFGLMTTWNEICKGKDYFCKYHPSIGKKCYKVVR